MSHGDFLRALHSLSEAYAILRRAVAAALPEQLAAIAAVDPLTRITLEQFGDPTVRWFRRGSRLRGVCVADGTIVFDGADVLFLPDVTAEHEEELPATWRERARRLARVKDGMVVLE